MKNINTELNIKSDTIYPPQEDWFRVFEMDVNEIKVVLLGQDPYHGPGQAHGLAFSVNKGIRVPPSLLNIFKELNMEYPDRNYEFGHGNLEQWFYREKIFLLNASLSVKEGKPGSFIKQWTPFTDDIIKFIADTNKNCIFLLLGNFAKDKMRFIDNKDRIIYGVHPSPLSAHRGFFGSNIFKKIEDLNGVPINWSIEP
jgi:uracil-DNA glycosylase